MNSSRIASLTAPLLALAATLLTGCGVSSPGDTALAAAAAAAAPAAPITPGTPTTPVGVPVATPTKVGHVWVIVLENEDYAKSFGGVAAPYLATTLPAQGALLKNFYGTGHVSLDNYISMISGQGANSMTQADCQAFINFDGSGPVAAMDGQAVGQGCVFPATVPNIADQLRAANISWKGYMEDMGNDSAHGVTATCGHPALNSQDKTQSASATDSYATRHNPFMYFHSVIDDQPYCDAHVVTLKALDADLASAAATPKFSFITPSLCHDGHDSPCANGEPGGLISVNDFLKVVAPKIMNSEAFKQDGLLLITFDESSGPQSDATACCGNASLNTTLPGLTGMGGGIVGAVAIAPHFIKPGTVSTSSYSHYSTLRTVEDIFGQAYLGYAGQSTQASFGKDVFSLQMPVFPPKS